MKTYESNFSLSIKTKNKLSEHETAEVLAYLAVRLENPFALIKIKMPKSIADSKKATLNISSNKLPKDIISFLNGLIPITLNAHSINKLNKLIRKYNINQQTS